MLNGLARTLATASALALLSAAPADAATRWGAYSLLGPAGADREAVLTSADELIVPVATEEGVEVVVQSPGGATTATQSLGPADWAGTQLAADRVGNAYFGRIAPDGSVQVLQRAAGGTFVLDRSFEGPAQGVDVAASSRGDLLIVWSTAGATFAAVRPAGGAWREPVKMPAMAGYPVARLSDAGWALIAWPGSQELSTADPLVLVTISPAGEASELELRAAHEGGPVTMAVDDAGRFAIGWPESDGAGYVYEGPLQLAYGHGGTITKRHSLGKGKQLSVVANRHGDALLTWRLHSETDYVFGVQPNRMATLDLRDGSVGADEPTVATSVATVNDDGARMLVGGPHSHWSVRARRGGLLRAVQSFGCDLNPSIPYFAAIDSKGQAIVVAQPMPAPWMKSTIGPHVVRDHPTDFWDPFHCAGVTRPWPIPTHVGAVAGRAVEVRVTAADDPEASRQSFQWDFEDDGTFDLDTGAVPAAGHAWPAPGRTAMRVRQQRWFGTDLEERSWRMDVDVAPAPPSPVTPVTSPPATIKPRLTIRGRSLRRALRSGLKLEAKLPRAGSTRFEVRRLPSRRLLAKKTRTLAAGRSTTVRVRLPRRGRRPASLRLEVRALQRGRVVARTRATLR